MNINQKASGRYKVWVANGDGSIAEERPFKPNLILDGGLDFAATNYWITCWRYAAIGTGSTPTADDSGLITATQSGTNVIASGSIFTVSDVGKLFVFDTGEESYITSYISVTEIEVADSRTVGSGTPFAMWRVNQTKLSNYSDHVTSQAFLGVTKYNGTVTENNDSKYIMKRTWAFSPAPAATTYNEIGFHKDDVSDPDIFSRVVIDGGIPVVKGQQVYITYEFTIQVDGLARNSVSLSIDGWPVSPSVNTNATVGLVGGTFNYVDVNGDTQNLDGGDPLLEPYLFSSSVFRLGFSSQTAFPSFRQGNLTGITLVSDLKYVGTYTPGSFILEKFLESNHDGLNGFNTFESTTIRTMVNYTTQSSANYYGWMAVFDQNQTYKLHDSMKIALKWTWGRTLAPNP